MSWTVQTGRTKAYLEQTSPYRDCQIEMVTDEIVQIMLTASLTEDTVDNLAWQLAHVIDEVALFADQETGNPFYAFITLFTQAWGMVCARKTVRRKESAGIPTLPVFLDGSLDQD